MLEALNILEGYNLKEMGRNSAPYLHAVTEALKLSFADRNAYVGDPKFVPNIPMAAAAVEGIRGGAPRADRSESRHRRRAGARRSARDETDDGRRRRRSTRSPQTIANDGEAVRSRTRS